MQLFRTPRPTIRRLWELNIQLGYRIFICYTFLFYFCVRSYYIFSENVTPETNRQKIYVRSLWIASKVDCENIFVCTSMLLFAILFEKKNFCFPLVLVWGIIFYLENYKFGLRCCRALGLDCFLRVILFIDEPQIIRNPMKKESNSHF